MSRRIMTAWIVGLAMGAALLPAAASALGLGLSVLPAQLHQQTINISFWGQPFPYGYTGWGPCIRYVPVETPWGTRWRRVRVCR